MNPIILFDGECKLCSAWVPFVINRDPDAVFKFCSTNGVRVNKAMPTNPIILFDGECKLCSAWVPFVIKRDPDAVFKFCSVQSPKGQELLSLHGLDTENFETMVLIKGNDADYRSEAFFEIIKQLKMPWPWLRILRIFPVRFRDWCYDRIALNRYKLFGKHNYCMIPSKEILDRFL